jgi:hypothetical protein
VVLSLADEQEGVMSRIFFDVSVRITMRNGAAGVVEITSQDLVSAREVKEALDRALRGLEALRHEPMQDAVPANLRVVG